MAFTFGGALGTAQSKGTGNTVTITTGATAPVGSLVVVCIGVDNVATTDGDHGEVVSVVDSAGNTYIKAGEWTNGQGAAVANLSFTSNAATITPSIALSGGAPAPVWRVTEADAQEYVYSTASFSHTRTAAGNMTVVLENTDDIRLYVTHIDFNGDGIISTLAELHIELFENLIQLLLYNTAVTGDITAVSWPATLEVLQLHNTAVSGDIAAVAWPATLEVLVLSITAVSGDIAAVAWPATLADLRLNGSTAVSGDIAAVSWPATLEVLFLHSTAASGDIAAVSWPATSRVLHLYNTAVSYSGTGQTLAPLLALSDFNVSNCSLSQSAVDAILYDLYSGCVNRTATNGTINVGGNNAAPSGTHQAAASCPVTGSTPGKEVAHELVNNGCGVASFNTWATVTFTA